MAIEDPLWPRADAWLSRGDPDPALVVAGVPSSAGSLSPSQAWCTPPRLRKVLERFSTFQGEHQVDLSVLAVSDAGDWGVDGLDLEASQAAIERQARSLRRGPVHAFLGGDNAITRPLARGLAGGRLSEVGLITLDAHHDVRVLDYGPTNGTPIRGLLEDGLLDGRVVQVGIHSFANSKEYRRYCEDHGIRVVTMEEVEREGLRQVMAEALAWLAERCGWIYVDFDLDVLDRAFAPACPGARPGGMEPRQLALAAWLCGSHRKVQAADFVEVDAAADFGDQTLMNLATTFLSFAAGVAGRREGNA
ncbi:MAG: agmatinase family protein [Actinomycetota bacterium]|nr:agmatinase family protein [Actinomycetota bacterium]